MRDPGTPRRNPFFEHGSDGRVGDLGMGWSDDGDEVSDGPDGPRVTDIPEGGVGGLATLLAVMERLSDAQPEAAEHLVAAAHEVVLTLKVLVDATEAVLAEQRDAMAIRSAERAVGAAESDPTVPAESDARSSTVSIVRDAERP